MFYRLGRGGLSYEGAAMVMELLLYDVAFTIYNNV